MPEEKEKNQELQLLIDFLTVREQNKQPYYYTVKIGRFAFPSEICIISHINNSKSTGVDNLIQLIDGCKKYKDYDYISVYLYENFKKHETGAKSHFDLRKIILREPSDALALSGGLSPALNSVSKEEIDNSLKSHYSIMQKDFEIAALKTENEKLKNYIKKLAVKLDVFKDKISTIKTRYLKLKKKFNITEQSSKKEIESLNDDLKLKKLLSVGLGNALTKIKVKGQDLGSIIGSFIDVDDVQNAAQQYSETKSQTENKQNFNVRSDNEQLSELDLLKKEMVRQVELFLKNQDEKICTDFYKVVAYISQSVDNMKNIIDLIK